MHSIRRVMLWLLYSFFVVAVTLYYTKHLKICFSSSQNKIVTTQHQQNAPPSFSALAEKLLPTVVNISASKSSDDDTSKEELEEDQTNDSSDGSHSPFEKFFRDYLNHKGVSEDGSGLLQALGSGVVIDASGWIVTNYHVVKDTDQIIVTLQNGQTLNGILKGFDERTDLALLKVSPDAPLLAAQFGNSDQSKIGDWVLAVGNPYGLSNTVTSGIISSRGRNIEQGPYDDFIQTDAPINKGNSGGPLFNMQGKVVGINTAIFSPSGGSIGIAFAIPSNEALWVIEQLRHNGKVFRGWLGVDIQEIDETLAKKLHITPIKGALVVGVDQNGPAARAGIQEGDVIVSINNQSVTAQTLPRMVARLKNGSLISLAIIRNDQQKTVLAKIAPLVEKEKQVSTDQQIENQSKILIIKGSTIEISDIDDLLLQKYNLPDGQRGVIVTYVKKKENMKKSLFQVGDVLIGVNDQEIKNISDLLELMKLDPQARKNKRKISPHTAIRLLIKSDDTLHWVTLNAKDITVH